MDGFTTVFIFTEKSNLLWNGSGEMAFGAIGFIGLSVWAAYAFYVIVFKKNWRRFTHLLLAIILIPSAIGLFRFGYVDMRDVRNEYLNIQKIYNSQSYEVAEGTVHVIKPGSPFGHDAGDIIHIGDVEFSVSCYGIQFSYSRAISCGGALTDGAFARVCYYVDQYGDSQILKIDVKK